MKLNDKWFLNNGEQLSTAEIFTKIIQNKMDSNSVCWNDANQHEIVSQKFCVLEGKYGILKQLGEGAFGIVSLGIDLKSLLQHENEKLVAIKRPTNKLLHQYAETKGYKTNPSMSLEQNKLAAIQWAKLELGQKFSQEALSTGRLAYCKNVVAILDHDIRLPYLVLEYCEGGSLKDKMKLDYTADDIERWAKEIANALNAAHSLEPAALIHRDLKPDNVLVSQGILKVSDFGTSIMKEESESLRSLKGGYTPRYAAPEAYEGKAKPATDIWSLGIILYELITKTQPFSGDSMPQLMRSIFMSEAPPLNINAKYQVSQKLQDLVMKSLNKDPSARPKAKDFIYEDTEIRKIPEENKIHSTPQKNILGNSQATTQKLPQRKTRTMAAIQRSSSRKTSMTKTSGENFSKRESLGATRRTLAAKTQKKNQQSSLILGSTFAIIALLGIVIWQFGSSSQKEKTPPKNNSVQEKQNLPIRDNTNEKQEMAIDSKEQETAPFDEKIWNVCWNGEYFDFSKEEWLSLDYYKQVLYARKYQEWFSREKNLEVTKTVEKNGVLFTFKLVPPGKFWIGAPMDEPNRLDNEIYYRVVISKVYWIGETEVTQKQWEKIMGNNPSFCKDVGPDAPVENVSWNECKMFCLESGFSLPTEAQWEYACRAGTTTAYNLGRYITLNNVNFQYDDGKIKGKTKTVIVKSLDNKNSWGCFDFHANVLEWCNDVLGSENKDNQVDPEGSPNIAVKALRGGCWLFEGGHCRSANRLFGPIEKKYNGFGFRVITFK